jgi:putative sigma-54 modulation protein
VDTIVKGRHMEVGPDIRAYAEEKIGKAVKTLNSMAMSAEIELYHERNRSIDKNQIAEVTVFTKGPTIRAREGATDMKAAIDLVAEKLEVQARKFKSRVVDRRTGKLALSQAIAPQEPSEEEEEIAHIIVKTKRVDLKPMSAEEAILQLELLGHDFFLFESAETEDLAVLYRRRDGDYGLIRPRST